LIHIQEYNLRASSSRTEEKIIAELFERIGRQSFDLTRGPLWYVCLVNLRPRRDILIINLPALCADTVTLNNLMYEISRSYASQLYGETIPREPLQYANLSQWRNELIKTDEAKNGRDFWYKQSPSIPLNTPAGVRPIQDRKFECWSLSLSIETDLIAGIKKL